MERKSGIPKPIHRLGSMESSFSTSNGNLLRMSLSPSPTEELSKSRWALNSSSSSQKSSQGASMETHNNHHSTGNYQRGHGHNDQLADENAMLKAEMNAMKKQILDLQRRFEKEHSTRDTFETIQFEQKKTIKTLQNNLDKQTMEYKMLLEKNAKFRQRLNEALPIDDGLLKDASLIGIGGEGKIQHADSRVMVGDEDLDEVIGEVEKLKNYVNKLELQIYEMNEKVSELIENNQQLERENKKLKVDNENMNRLAKMVTENMKDSIDTNKRLEDEIRQIKAENDNLIRQRNNNNVAAVHSVSFAENHHYQQQQQFQQQVHLNRVSGGGGGHTMMLSNGNGALPINAINNINHPGNNMMAAMNQVNQPQPPALPLVPPPVPKKPEHLPPTKRITEMHERELTQVVEEELTRTVELLNCKLGLIEEELHVAISRVEKAELELTEMRRASRLGLLPKGLAAFDEEEIKIKSPIPIPPPPPPPPPPTPAQPAVYLPKIKLRMPGRRAINQSEGDSNEDAAGEDSSYSNCGGSLKPSTGMALISELKSGQVTLRRRKRQETTNPALRELFETLERSQKQNRSSKTFLLQYKICPEEEQF